jgi:EAL and modified HD-GYP domain-containing signal transduction protein
MGLLGFLSNLVSRRSEETPLTSDTRLSEPTLSDNFAAVASPAQSNFDNNEHSFVRRDAILNRAEQIAGYEFSLVTRLKARMTRQSGVAARAYDVALLTRLQLHRDASLLGNRLALVCLSIDSLDNEAIDRLPHDNTVLVFDLNARMAPLAEIQAGLAALQDKGFRVGIHILDANDKDSPLTDAVDWLLINVAAFDGLDLRTLTRKLKSAGATPPRLIAGNVQSDDDFQLCYKCGFDLFQGAFVAGSNRLQPTRNAINRTAALSILNMLRTDQSYAAIANELKSEPTLSYKLLRYLNSAAVGLQSKVDNLTDALVLLGRDKFYRWTSLLLFDFDKPGYQEYVLAERALTRGRTLELLAGKGQIPATPDQLFLIGLFSLLDQAMGRPLPELIEQAALAASVRDALLGQPGPGADALALVKLEASIDAPPEGLAKALAACGIDDETYSPIALEALVWVDQMLSDRAT